MEFRDPRAYPFHEPSAKNIFAVSQRQGGRPRQEDACLVFRNECFVIADGVGGQPNGDVASKLAAETALWAYTFVRQKPFYWEEKSQLMKRIFRTTNMTVWQKRREKNYQDGLFTTLLVAIVRENRYWVGSAGDSVAYLYTPEKNLRQITKEDTDSFGRLTKVLGQKRLGLHPQIIYDYFPTGTVLLLTSDGVSQFVTKQNLLDMLSQVDTSEESLRTTTERILDRAEENGSADNMTACIIKRVPVS